MRISQKLLLQRHRQRSDGTITLFRLKGIKYIETECNCASFFKLTKPQKGLLWEWKMTEFSKNYTNLFWENKQRLRTNMVIT